MNAAIQHHIPINFKINMLELHIKTYDTLVATSVTSKLLTLLTQHVKNVHEKICGLQCRICEYASESPSDVHNHVKAVRLKIMNLKCEEVWR